MIMKVTCKSIKLLALCMGMEILSQKIFKRSLTLIKNKNWMSSPKLLPRHQIPEGTFE